jgi:transcriptional regulator with XRE-family HTH domain
VKDRGILAIFDAMTFSDQIRRAFNTCGLSRYRIAVEADVAESVLSRFMKGGGISTTTLDRVAEVLRLEVTMQGPRARVLKKPRR